MVKTNYYNGLNPAVSQALINCNIENNPKYFSKNGFIYMTERSRDREFTVEKRSFYIYCTVCDTLVFFRKNTIEYANHHLNECIAKTAKKHFAYSNPIQKKGEKNMSSFSSDKRSYRVYNTENEFREKIAYSLFNGAKIIQWAWRAFKLRPETWAK
ncbi:10655_t:CDS:2 [Gigaspora margarita]|uniref:10655_t:CDS:1 n=1 Tax=Gigaspora margarita TaxID=4874 RepID=A0ABM8W0Y6_GIGMA|nr:10655_t:CDS:2 [Gigaspora margarita]